MATVIQQKKQSQDLGPTLTHSHDELADFKPHNPENIQIEIEQNQVTTQGQQPVKAMQNIPDELKPKLLKYRSNNQCWRVVSVIFFVLSLASCIYAFSLEYFWMGAAGVLSMGLWSMWYRATTQAVRAINFEEYVLIDNAKWWLGCLYFFYIPLQILYIVALVFSVLTYTGTWNYKDGQEESEWQDDEEFLYLSVISLSLTVFFTFVFIWVAYWLRSQAFQTKKQLVEAKVITQSESKPKNVQQPQVQQQQQQPQVQQEQAQPQVQEQKAQPQVQEQQPQVQQQEPQVQQQQQEQIQQGQIQIKQE